MLLFVTAIMADRVRSSITGMFMERFMISPLTSFVDSTNRHPVCVCVCVCVCVREREIKLLDFSVEQLPPLIHIREFTLSNRGWREDIHTDVGLLSFRPSRQIPRQFLEIDQDPFLPHYVVFINHPTSSVGPCHNGKLCSQVSDEGTASIYEG